VRWPFRPCATGTGPYSTTPSRISQARFSDRLTQARAVAEHGVPSTRAGAAGPALPLAPAVVTKPARAIATVRRRTRKPRMTTPP
jgi:hypothetical protein